MDRDLELEEEMVGGNSWEGPAMAEVGGSRTMNRFMLRSGGNSRTGGSLGMLWGWCGGHELCRGRNRKDSRKRYLGISSELNCCQYLFLLLQPGNKGGVFYFLQNCLLCV